MWGAGWWLHWATLGGLSGLLRWAAWTRVQLVWFAEAAAPQGQFPRPHKPEAVWADEAPRHHKELGGG